MQLVLSTNQVYTFKLNSGEEMVAKVIESGGNTVRIENPVSIAPGQHGMQLIPSIFTAEPDGEIRLNTSSVSLYGLTEDSVKMKYIEATTGLKIPDKKIVMG
jgi:hypothetical protein